MQTNRRQKNSPAQQKHRPEYLAVVRFLDDTTDTFRVRFADGIDDARELVLMEVGDVRTILITERG